MPRQAASGKRLSVWTSLPGTPLDGQEILYRFTQTVNPADAAVILWHLRYDTAVGAWLPVGRQQPIHAMQSANESTSFGANTWGGVSANDPNFTAPRSGDYDIEWGCGTWNVNVLGNNYIAVYYTGSEQTANGVQPTSDICCPSGVSSTFVAAMGTKKMTLAAGNQLKHRYYLTGAATITRGSAWIKVYPRKITG